MLLCAISLLGYGHAHGMEVPLRGNRLSRLGRVAVSAFDDDRNSKLSDVERDTHR